MNRWEGSISDRPPEGARGRHPKPGEHRHLDTTLFKISHVEISCGRTTLVVIPAGVTIWAHYLGSLELGVNEAEVRGPFPIWDGKLHPKTATLLPEFTPYNSLCCVVPDECTGRKPGQGECLWGPAPLSTLERLGPRRLHGGHCLTWSYLPVLTRGDPECIGLT